MKVYYHPTFTNVFILSSPYLYPLEHVEVDNLIGVTVSQGDIIVGLEYTNKDYPQATILGYKYITGVGFTNNREEDMVRFIFRDEPWIIEPILSHSFALEALFSAYGIFAYKHVKTSMESTIEHNRDVVYSYALRLKDYKSYIERQETISDHYKVIRNSKYVRNLDISRLTYIIICNGNNGVYLKVIGSRRDTVIRLVNLKSNVINDIGYIFLPDSVKDVSIDAIEDILKSKL
mgnify:CR=1 FL=1